MAPELNTNDISAKILDFCERDRKLIDETYARFMRTYDAYEAAGHDLDSLVNGIAKTLQLRIESSEKAVTQLLRLMAPQSTKPTEKTLKQILNEKKETRDV